MLSPRQTDRPRVYVDSIESLERAFHELIPISQAMGIRVVSYNGLSLTTTAPLSQNINHQHSAFGGSLFSLAALSGWGLMQMKLSELLLDCNTVVMGGEVSYQQPVYDDLECVVTLPGNPDAIFDELADKGTVRTELIATCECDGKTAMQMTGKYHLKLRTPSEA